MANIRSRSGLLWKKWGRECMFFATGFGFLLIVLLPSLNSWKKESDMIPKHFPGTSPGDLVDLTLLQSSKVKGADGSAPGYHLQRGFGSGSNYWIVHIEGGGWCNTLESCSLRKNTALGSSTFMEKQVPFSGFLSSNQSQNPGVYVLAYAPLFDTTWGAYLVFLVQLMQTTSFLISFLHIWCFCFLGILYIGVWVHQHNGFAYFLSFICEFCGYQHKKKVHLPEFQFVLDT